MVHVRNKMRSFSVVVVATFVVALLVSAAHGAEHFGHAEEGGDSCAVCRLADHTPALDVDRPTLRVTLPSAPRSCAKPTQAPLRVWQSQASERGPPALQPLV